MFDCREQWVVYLQHLGATTTFSDVGYKYKTVISIFFFFPVEYTNDHQLLNEFDFIFGCLLVDEKIE